MQVNEYKSTKPPGSLVQKLQWSVPLGHQKLVTKIVLVFNLNVPQEKKNIFKIFQLSLEAKGYPSLDFSAMYIPEYLFSPGRLFLILLRKEE